MVIIRLFLPPFDGVLSYRRVSDPVNILSPFSLPYHKNPILHGSFLGFARWFIVLPLFLSNPYFLYNSNLSVPVYADSPSHILFPSSHSMHCIVCIISSSLLSHPSLWQDPPRVTHRRFCISRLHSLMPYVTSTGSLAHYLPKSIHTLTPLEEGVHRYLSHPSQITNEPQFGKPDPWNGEPGICMRRCYNSGRTGFRVLRNTLTFSPKLFPSAAPNTIPEKK